MKMERKRYFLRTENILWVLGTISFAMVTLAVDVTPTSSSRVLRNEEIVEEYAWSSWSSWTPCSKTCGGGVALQERSCLQRSRSKVSNTSSPAEKERKNRQSEEDCEGVAKRYHECNTMACPGNHLDPRAEQCSSYDSRPFRGRFFTWLPYIDGNSPCTLNCRPRGQQFYASLALVADGTPCTKPGFRAICVQGLCKVRKLKALGGASVGQYSFQHMRQRRCQYCTNPRRAISGASPTETLPRYRHREY